MSNKLKVSKCCYKCDARQYPPVLGAHTCWNDNCPCHAVHDHDDQSKCSDCSTPKKEMKSLTLKTEQEVAYLEKILAYEYEREGITEAERMMAYKLLESLQENI